jgi:hypothetical protein
VIGLIQVPEAFPEIQDCTLILGCENQLLSPTWTIPGISREKAPRRSADDCPYHQCDEKPTHEPFLLDQFENREPSWKVPVKTPILVVQVVESKSGGIREMSFLRARPGSK